MLPDLGQLQAFAADPRAYLEQRDASRSRPQRLQELLMGLSGDELTFLAGAQDKLDSAQLLKDRPNEPGGFATLTEF